jgi:hypothetical protein
MKEEEKYSKEYYIIKKEIETKWPDYRKETHNINFAVSLHSNKI